MSFQLKPLKHVATLNDEVLPESLPLDAPISYAEVSDVHQAQPIQWKDPLPFGQAPTRARRIVRHGDILISTVRTYLRAVTRVSYPPSRGIVSTGFAVVRPTAGYSKYLGYILQSDDFIDEVVSRSVGVSYPAIAPSELASLRVPFPEIEVQRKIADFLDRETAEIDAFIADQEELIALLEERRTATITHAVTKGLDPDAPMKDSDIEWLNGSLTPLTWRTWKLGRLAQLQSGEAITSASIEANGTYPVFGGGGFRGYTESHTNDGDYVLIGRQGALCGNIRKTPGGRFFATEHAIVVYPFGALNRSWLAAILQVMDLGQYSQSAAQPGISVNVISQKYLPVPPLAEQGLIADFLDRETTEFDAAMADAREAIVLSQERRAALISAAVTGQIDVTEKHKPVAEVLEDEVRL